MEEIIDNPTPLGGTIFSYLDIISIVYCFGKNKYLIVAEDNLDKPYHIQHLKQILYN